MCFSVEVIKELKIISDRFQSQLAMTENNFYESLKSNPVHTKIFKEAGEDKRIYPGYFTWVMVQDHGVSVLKKMRYRVRPAESVDEIPSKFNVFNARVDSLETRQTWKKLFTKQHGIFPFSSFFEWVEFEGKKKLIKFNPQGKDIMWAPCLWDYWTNKEGSFGFYSFALITDEPPAEVAQMGHDRCPIFLKENLIKEWLNPQHYSKDQLYEILKNKEQVLYQNQWVA